MLRFLYTGDWHLRGTNPRNRIDDYQDAVAAKLRECYSLAQKWDCTAILAPGDIWDRPEVSIGVLLHFVELLKESPVPIYTTPGNHDVYGYNVATFERSSLKLLEMLVPQFTVITDPARVQTFTDGVDTAAEVTFMPFNAKMDINGFGYDPGPGVYSEGPQGAYGVPYRVHIAHGMLLDHEPPFDRYTVLKDAYTTADLVLTGHDHIGYGVYTRPGDRKIFCNPGALLRIAASTSEVERTVQVALITIQDHIADVMLIPLQSAKPGVEVLDRTKIEAEKQRAYAMETFAAAIQAKTGEKVILDVNQIVETIAQQEGSAPHIVKAALDAIDAQRENVKP